MFNPFRKFVNFIRSPHLPWILEKGLKDKFPKLHRILKYRTADVTSKRYWNGVWKEEGESTWRFYPNLFGKILEIVPPHSLVLDIGCGPGVLLNRLKKEKRCEGFGLDISFEALRILKKNNISGVVAKLPHIPIKDSAFDILIATEVLEHLENPKETLREMKRIAKKNALIICSVPNESFAKCDEHLWDFNFEKFENLIKDLGDYEILTIEDKGGERMLGIVRVKSE